MKTTLKLAAVLLLIAGTLPLSAQQGKLKFKVNPGRAGVFIDGKYAGPASRFGAAKTYPVAPGEHEIKLAEARYEEMTTKVTAEANKTVVVTQTLKALPLAKPPFGELRTMNADNLAAVYINGKYYGHVDEYSNFAQRLLLPPGEYTVRIVPVSGSPVVEEKVKLEANKTVVVGAKGK